MIAMESKSTHPIPLTAVELQPKPLPLERPHAAFFEHLVNPLPSSPAPKQYCPDSVSRFVTQWVESVSKPEAYRERHCRSDSLLGHSGDDLFRGRLTMSAPNMDFARDLQDHSQDHSQASFPAKSAGNSGITASASGSNRSSERLVKNPLYRVVNLISNNIYLRSRSEQFPEHINSLVDHIGRDRSSPGPSADDLWQDEDLEALETDAAEADVQNYFQTEVFLRSKGALKRSDKLPMARGVVPDAGSKFMLSTPTPDLLYGYNRLTAFTKGQQAQLASMGNNMTANSKNLTYPFFVIEFKAEGAFGGLSVATNQCLGGSASCVNIAERLNCQLRQCEHPKVTLINSAAFSIAMNGIEAQLYISWKHDELEYYTRKVDSFSLQRPEDYIRFRKQVLNIIDWGKGERLNHIRISLDRLLEENREKASQQAKSRPPPSLDDFARGNSKKHKCPPSRRRESKGGLNQSYQ